MIQTIDDTLGTERLNLERLTTDDAKMMLAIWNDPWFRKFVGDRGIRSVEAALAVFTQARDVLRLRRVNGIVAGGNTRSIHLLEKLGLRYEKTIRLPDDDEDVRLYRRRFDAAGDG